MERRQRSVDRHVCVGPARDGGGDAIESRARVRQVLPSPLSYDNAATVAWPTTSCWWRFRCAFCRRLSRASRPSIRTAFAIRFRPFGIQSDAGAGLAVSYAKDAR